VIIVFRDPDEISLTPDELVKANRFESLGLLAGGIAHDFNNLLTTILGGVSLAKDNRDNSSLGDAEKACLTAKGLTKQLLLFAKGGTGTQTVVAVKEIFEDTLKIATAGSVATVTLEVAPQHRSGPGRPRPDSSGFPESGRECPPSDAARPARRARAALRPKRHSRRGTDPRPRRRQLRRV